MEHKKLLTFDSTLRDGAQGANISFSVEDKLRVIDTLDSSASTSSRRATPTPTLRRRNFFSGSRVKKFRTRQHRRVRLYPPQRDRARRGREPEIAAGGEHGVRRHFRQKPHPPRDGRAQSHARREPCHDRGQRALLSAHGKKVVFDAEHFFDGYKTDADYAMRALSAAAEAGAWCLCLCDTNGGIFPDEAYAITKAVCEAFPGTCVAIHCHNDGGLAVAASVEAVRAGAAQVQGTFLGFGEPGAATPTCAR